MIQNQDHPYPLSIDSPAGLITNSTLDPNQYDDEVHGLCGTRSGRLPRSLPRGDYDRSTEPWSVPTPLPLHHD
jgi:hypothetical protein